MAKNKFFYNTNNKGVVQKTVADLTGTVNTTISGNANNIITYDITFSDDRANGLTFFFQFNGVSSSDFINGTQAGNTVISGSNTVSISRTLDSENTSATGISISGRINSDVGKNIVTSPVTNIVEVDGPKIAGTTTADGKANLTIFSANGNLQIQSLSSFTGLNKVRALVVGGGGATGHQLNANIANVFNAGVTSVGGGGGGEVVNREVFLANTDNVPVTVGVGGSFDTYANSDGRDSSIDSGLTTIVANGGGGGGCARPFVGAGEGVSGVSGNNIQQLGFLNNTIDGRDGGSGGGAACESTDISSFVVGGFNNNLSSIFKGRPGNASVTGAGQGSQGGHGAGHGKAGIGSPQANTFQQRYYNGPYVKIAFSTPSVFPANASLSNGPVGNVELHGPHFTEQLVSPHSSGVSNLRPLGGGGGGGAGAIGGKGNANAIVNVFNGYNSAKTGGDGGDGVSYTIFNTAGNTVFYGGGGGGGPTFLDLQGFDLNSFNTGGSLMTGGHVNFNTQGPGNNSYLARPGDPGQGGSNANIGGGGSVQFIVNKGGKELHEQGGGNGTVIVRSKLKYRVFQA